MTRAATQLHLVEHFIHPPTHGAAAVEGAEELP
jgi:hypothetical protein